MEEEKEIRYRSSACSQHPPCRALALVQLAHKLEHLAHAHYQGLMDSAPNVMTCQ
jgi:hypothetical protein